MQVERIVNNLDDPLRDLLSRDVAAVYLIALALSLIFFSKEVALGVMAGGGIGLYSFMSLRKSLERAFSFMLNSGGGPKGYMLVRHYLKLTVVFLLLLLLMKDGRADTLGLVTGLFVVPAAFIYRAVRLYILNFGLIAEERPR